MRALAAALLLILSPLSIAEEPPEEMIIPRLQIHIYDWIGWVELWCESQGDCWLYDFQLLTPGGWVTLATPENMEEPRFGMSLDDLPNPSRAIFRVRVRRRTGDHWYPECD